MMSAWSKKKSNTETTDDRQATDGNIRRQAYLVCCPSLLFFFTPLAVCQVINELLKALSGHCHVEGERVVPFMIYDL